MSEQIIEDNLRYLIDKKIIRMPYSTSSLTEDLCRLARKSEQLEVENLRLKRCVDFYADEDNSKFYRKGE